MLENQELLLGSHQLNQNTSVFAWNYTTGNVEYTYKNGGTPLNKSMRLLANDYILTADQDKPLLHVWPVNSQEQVKNIRFVMPEIICCLDIDSSNNYLIAGIGLKLYVWHINSGKLLNILQKHYQPITCVKFSSDSTYVIVTGKDGILTVYKLNEIVCSQKNIGECEPIYTKMDQTSQITDVSLGSFGPKSRVATISNDFTCRVYTLQTGELILSLVFSNILTSVTFDSTSWNMYVGDINGLIRRIDLKNPPRTLQHHITASIEDSFVGHEKKITCLDINHNNDILASGSEDFTIIIWTTATKKKLRTIVLNGIITNLKFVLKHANFQAQTLKSNIILHPLQRNVDTNVRNFVTYGKPNQIIFEDEYEEECTKVENKTDDPQSEIKNLKIINKQIYDAFIKMAKKYNDIK